MSAPEQRSAPLHCPYCGDTDLRPDATDGSALPHGSWRCGSCRRSYSLRLLAVGHPATAASQTREAQP